MALWMKSPHRWHLHQPQQLSLAYLHKTLSTLGMCCCQARLYHSRQCRYNKRPCRHAGAFKIATWRAPSTGKVKQDAHVAMSVRCSPPVVLLVLSHLRNPVMVHIQFVALSGPLQTFAAFSEYKGFPRRAQRCTEPMAHCASRQP